MPTSSPRGTLETQNQTTRVRICRNRSSIVLWVAVLALPGGAAENPQALHDDGGGALVAARSSPVGPHR
jgi:hypothetical protein